MSYLIIGNDINALYFAKVLNEYGWKVTLITKNKFEYGPEFTFFEPDLLPRYGFPAINGLKKEYDFVEVCDLSGRNTLLPTATQVLDLSTLKNKLFNDIVHEITYHEHASFIDQNGENTFITVDGKGTMIKVRYVINFEDLGITQRFGNNIRKTEMIHANVRRNNTDGNINIFFLPKGYGWIINITPEIAHICINSENCQYEFENYVKTNKLRVLYFEKTENNLYNEIRVAQNNHMFLAGNALGISDNLNLDSLSPGLAYCQDFIAYFHKLMTLESGHYYQLFEKKFDFMKKSVKLGKYFWNANAEDKNDLLKYYNPKHSVLDFDTMFENLPVLSKHKIKLVFNR